MKQVVLAAAATFALSSGAYANWNVTNSEKDVFGAVNVTATSYGDNGNIIRFECGSSSEPFFVFLIRDNSGEIADIPARFLHVDQKGDRVETDAVLESWNEKYAAVKVTDKRMLRRIAEHMIVATKSIPVGIILTNTDWKIADTFSPRGSTKAGNILLKHCLSD